MSFQVTEILGALHDAGARYVVVGGFAVILHGHLRTTADLDLVLDLEQTNLCKALQALGSLGLRPRLPVEMADFADPALRRSWAEDRSMEVFQLWDPANPVRSVDLFVREPIAFEALWDGSIIESLGGVDVRIASIEHLIAMKRQAGRERDRLDIEALQAIRDEQADDSD